MGCFVVFHKRVVFTGMKPLLGNLHLWKSRNPSAPAGTYKVRNEIETKRNETKRNQRKRNETKRNQRNGNKMKRNQRKQNGID